jgi:molybdate transport system substrate-binding protein
MSSRTPACRRSFDVGTRLLGLVLTIVGLVTSACAAEPTRLDVFAAASLTASFRAMGAAFEAAHPNVKIAFNFGGSSTLVQQIREGAPADVFASADEATMQKIVEANAVSETPRIFARNSLQIAVAKGNPHRITGLSDLGKPGLVVVLCGDTVPCGRYGLEAFAKAGAKAPPGSREPDVKAVLNKVALGEADAGIVYVTDVRAARDTVEGVDIPVAHNVVGRYPIAALRDAAHADAGRAFIAFVLSDPGTMILGEYGFQRP